MQRPYSLYENQSVFLADVAVPPLPETIEFAGQQLFIKDEFHITLLSVQYLARQLAADTAEQVKAQLVEEFEHFVAETPLDQYEITGPLRFVEDEAYKTIIVMVEVPHIEDLFDCLRNKFSANIPTQQTHVTLYRHPKDYIGIAIPSAEVLERTSRIIEVPGLPNYGKN